MNTGISEKVVVRFLLLIACATAVVSVRAFILRTPRRVVPARMDVAKLQPEQVVRLSMPTTTRAIVTGRLRVWRNPVIASDERSVIVPVLMYHYIRPILPGMTTSSRWLSVSPEHFHAQMEELVRFGYHTITPDDLADAVAGTRTLPARPVVLTFDDGYRDQYDAAFPVLQTLGLTATFFLISDYDTNPLYMTKEMIGTLDRSGFATIA
ncbi:MAG: polysaccharide deacetylase family protein, partial [Patescibacteria group bacterium]